MSDRVNHYGKRFTEEEKTVMARMAAQLFPPSEIARRIGTTRLRVRDWLNVHHGEIADAEESIKREAQALKVPVREESFIRAPTLAELMGGR